MHQLLLHICVRRENLQAAGISRPLYVHGGNIDECYGGDDRKKGEKCGENEKGFVDLRVVII